MLQFITHRNDLFDEISGTRAVLEGGCRWVQLRMKEASEEEFLRTGAEVGRLCRACGATFLLDDRVELVHRLGADGVHLGKNDMPPREAPRAAGPPKDHRRHGQHVRGYQACRGPGRRLHRAGPLPLYAHEGEVEPHSRDRRLPGDPRPLRRAGHPSSVVAIGGITAADVDALMATGIAGIALSGALLNAENPAEETKKNHEYPQKIQTMNDLIIGGRTFRSRLFVGTGKFSSNDVMARAIAASGTEMVTLAMKRIDMSNPEDDMLAHVRRPEIQLLPNTSGVRDAEEAILAAQLARRPSAQTSSSWRSTPIPNTCCPTRSRRCAPRSSWRRWASSCCPTSRPTPCCAKRLEEAGAATVMPLAAPIGTNKGLVTREMLEIIIEQSNVPWWSMPGSGRRRTPRRPWSSVPTPCWSIRPLP